MMPSTAVYSSLQPLPFCAWRIGTHLQIEFGFDWAFELGETEAMVTDNGKPLIELPRERGCRGSRHLTANRTKAY